VVGTASVVGAASPARSAAPTPTSPSNASSTASPSVRRPDVDLLDSQHEPGYPANRVRSGLTASDDDQTEPSSETGNNNDNVGYTRSDAKASVTSTFERLIESTKVSASSPSHPERKHLDFQASQLFFFSLEAIEHD